ncbi:choloylglycine hydrolase family protein [Formosa sp. PL04]|uniref:choloylglycine hydrolase family protein n=1 Tax=Formosa sp. PL04 TaxID=3081755 RepID=UPI0029823D87|nr:choloylglycine hydrolase family protein [Formosa sp. PL04]MDW5289620.1 choloylglycine hydrolase family protein [Formosa sp. PL04]
MKVKKVFTLMFLCYFLCIQSSFACTGIVIRTENGSVIVARTLEFGFDLKSDILVIPKGTSIDFLSSVTEKVGYKMKAKYGFTGMNAAGKNIVIDGINEAGLYMGSFYFSGFAVYEKLTPDNQSKAVSSEEMGNFILGSFSTVDEVIAGLKDVTVVGSYISEIQGEAPLHYAVTDKSGKSIVIEYSKDGLKIFDNTVNVVTNNPSYDWHLTNLRNYVNLTPDNVNGITLNGEKFTPLSEGSGMLGLPGDCTSVSRFVRATAFVNAAEPCKDEEEGIFRAFHILNNFDIPIGIVKQKEKTGSLSEYTVWTAAADVQNGAYYYKTYNNPSIKKVDVKDILKEANGKIMVIKSNTPRTYETVTAN